MIILLYFCGYYVLFVQSYDSVIYLYQYKDYIVYGLTDQILF